MLVKMPARIATAGSFYNGILNDSRTACFTDASSCTKTRRRLTPSNNRNLLLSDDAQNRYQAALEIYADDVKCTTAPRSGRFRKVCSTALTRPG